MNNRSHCNTGRILPFRISPAQIAKRRVSSLALAREGLAECAAAMRVLSANRAALIQAKRRRLA